MRYSARDHDYGLISHTAGHFPHYQSLHVS